MAEVAFAALPASKLSDGLMNSLRHHPAAFKMLSRPVWSSLLEGSVNASGPDALEHALMLRENVWNEPSNGDDLGASTSVFGDATPSRPRAIRENLAFLRDDCFEELRASSVDNKRPPSTRHGWARTP